MLDDLPLGVFSGWAWIYRTADGDNQYIMAKDNAHPMGWGFLLDQVVIGTQGQIRFLVFRATATDFVSVLTDVVPLDTWVFVAFTYDDAATPRVKLYKGTLSTVVAETGYFRTDAGSGALTSDAPASLRVGHLEISAGATLKGRIARGGVVTRVLAASELRTIQFGSVPDANVADTKLLFDYHTTGSQTDHSGNGNTGTVTSAVTATHVGLPILFGPGEGLFDREAVLDALFDDAGFG